jgi:hypothetical protein
MKLKLKGMTPDFYLEFAVMKDLIEKFRELGFIFTSAYPHAVIEDKENTIFEECDITLENNDKVMIVEVMSVPTAAGIREHVERLHKIRSYASLHGDNRIVLGAVAGMFINDRDRDFALQNGIFVIEPAGGKLGIPDTTPLSDMAGYAARTFIITVPQDNCFPANEAKAVNDRSPGKGHVAWIFSEGIRRPPATLALSATKTAFPSTLRKKQHHKTDGVRC